jgi:hypothetical protein
VDVKTKDGKKVRYITRQNSSGLVKTPADGLRDRATDGRRDVQIEIKTLDRSPTVEEALLDVCVDKGSVKLTAPFLFL